MPTRARLVRLLHVTLILILLSANMTLRAEDNASKARVSSRPNFVLILADDMGYGDIGSYGGWIETPHLDRLATEGLRFTDFHSNGAVCSPTRAALMTGRYQQRSGVSMVVSVKLRHLGLQPQETTFAEVLKEAGYATAIFGKWHLGYETKYNPTRQGFDRFRGYVSGNIDFFSHVDQSGVFDWWQQDKLLDEPGYTTHLITQHALDFIDANKDRPFCLYLPHEAPHYPYQGPNDRADRTAGGKFNTHGSRSDKKEAYREMVIELDNGVGQVMAKLKEHNLDDNTLVFFFSDNGATPLGSNGKLRGHKGSVWEGGHRVPAIARWPGQIKPGVTNQTAIGMDLMPTLLAIAGQKPSTDRRLDGVDLSEVLLHGQPLGLRQLFWQHGDQLAIRHGPWKLVKNARGLDGKTGFYNLNSDLSESRNLAKSEYGQLAKMAASLADWRESVEQDATRQPDPHGNRP